MSNIPSIKPEDVAKILIALGYILVRQRGSHQIYNKGDSIIVVPMHNKDMKKGTLNQIVKATGLSIEEFLSYL
jgi:predicted RNA binding protein YcfA (HicA-like mRNA interferase family)